jgi:hypothetical protein
MGGTTGGGGGDGALGAGGGFGTAGHGTGCLSWIVTPWSFTATGWPFAVTCPAVTWASPLAPETVLVAVTSTTTLLTRTLPIAKLWTSEWVITVRLPLELTTVCVIPDAPLNGWAPPPAL